MHEVETNEFPRLGGEKNRLRDLVLEWKVTKVVDDYVEKKAFAI